MHDIQWACCEFRKTWTAQGRRRKVPVVNQLLARDPFPFRKSSEPLPLILESMRKKAKKIKLHGMTPKSVGKHFTNEQRKSGYKAIKTILAEANADGALLQQFQMNDWGRSFLFEAQQTKRPHTQITSNPHLASADIYKTKQVATRQNIQHTGGKQQWLGRFLLNPDSLGRPL